jgi:hypothetical protein
MKKRIAFPAGMTASIDDKAGEHRLFLRLKMLHLVIGNIPLDDVLVVLYSRHNEARHHE